MADPKAPVVNEVTDRVEPVATVSDASAPIQAEVTPANGTRLETAALAAVPDGSTFTFKPKDGPELTGNVTRVENRNILTTTAGDTYDVRQQPDKRAVLIKVEKDPTTGKITDVPSGAGVVRPIVIPPEGVTMSNPVNDNVTTVKAFTPSGVVLETGDPGRKGDTVLSLASPSLPATGIESPLDGKRLVAPMPTPEITDTTRIRVAALPSELQREIGRDNGIVTVSDLPPNGRALVTEAIKSGMLKPNDDGVYRGHDLKSQPYIRAAISNPVVLTGNVDTAVIKGVPAGFVPPADLSYKGTFPGRHFPGPGTDAINPKFPGPGTDAINPKFPGIGDGLPPWAVRNFGNHSGELVMRDPSKMPGFDLGGERGMRNMLEFWKGIQGLKPGDNLNSLFDMMNGKMSGRDLIRLSDFLSGQLGRKGSEALGMQDIMNLSTLFKGFGDRAGLNMQFGDSRSSLMMSFGLNGRFDFQIRFGALTLGFGDRGQSGLQQIGRLLFTSDGRQTQASLGTGALRAGDILSRSFAGQGQGQWNPFGPSTGDGALRTTQLTARLTQGNQDFISQMRDNSARLTQQLDASKLAQMSKTPGLLPGDLKPGQLDPGGKGQILQNFDPLRQDAGKLQPGQRLDGPKILTGNIEMDARTMDGMGGRRGPLTAAAHEASMKGDLQNLQGKGDQMLPGAKLPGEKLTVEEEAAKKKLEEEKKKGDLRSGEQFIQDEQERKAKERREQEEDREEELEALSEQDEAKRRALLLILEARRKREKELKEKALKEQITKQEEAKRAQYRVAIGDSLENIATKQLRNPRLAGLIFDINKKVVPIKFMNGKEVAVLNVGAILSLPSVKEIKDFSQAGFTLGPKFNKVDFTMPAVSQQGKTAEDELEAMFGSNWHGTEAGEGQSDLSQNVPQNGKSQEEMDEFTKRRLNIESVLGQMGPKRAADGRMRYTVRLGDTLKSIAMKHPALEDVSSWRLLAELNNLSTDTDANDNPKAIVPRGSVLMIPTKFEVEEHKRKMGLRKAIVLPGQSVTTGSALPALKHCPNCGQKSLHTATLCDCGSEFVTDSLPANSEQAHPSAPYLVGAESQPVSQAATNSFLTGQPVKKEDRFELAAKSGHVDGDHWSDVANLDPETRIVKLNSVFDPSLEFSLLLLQALVEGRWLPVAGYEMRENAAIRIDYTDAKSRSTVKIDLPPSAAQDLAKNDLIKNWQNYKRKFVTILPS